MKNMTNRKPLLIVILFVVLLFFIGLIPFSHSKYESETTGKVENAVAYYILDTAYSVNSITLPSLIPSVKPYIYRFTIANNDGTNRTETNLEYELFLRTTTNLPLQYSLYLNQEYNDVNAENIIISDVVSQDIDGTYFKLMTTSKRYFSFVQNEIDYYTLVIYFPIEYNTDKYQDLIESIELVINSKQIIE